MKKMEVLFTPAEFEAARSRDLLNTVCVVFDILRATSSMITALANGAAGIIPVQQIAEAVALRARNPKALLAGERDGLRISADLTGGIPFDLGNSPREFTRERVDRRQIIMTTTNGTRALRACAEAKLVLAACFLNLRATADLVHKEKVADLLLVCSGTLDQAAYEDTLAAGALCEELWPLYAEGAIADSAQIARKLFQLERQDVSGALTNSRNGRRLASRPELSDDVNFCAQRDIYSFAAALGGDGVVARLT